MRHDVQADVSYLLFRDGAGVLKAVALSWVADIATNANTVSLGAREQFSWHGKILPLIVVDDPAECVMTAVTGNAPQTIMVLRSKGVAMGVAVKRAVDIMHCEARLARAYAASGTVWYNGHPAVLFDPAPLFAQKEDAVVAPPSPPPAFTLAGLRTSLRGFFAMPPRTPSRAQGR